MLNKLECKISISVFGVLGIAFVALKLMGYIDWSWWYVTMPFWVRIAAALCITGVVLIYWGIVELFMLFKK